MIAISVESPGKPAIKSTPGSNRRVMRFRRGFGAVEFALIHEDLTLTFKVQQES